MPEVSIGRVPASEAIAHIREKMNIPTARWDDMMGGAHAKGFTVAGATKMDLLANMHEAVAQALESGSTITDFRRDFDHIVAKHGWSYKGSRGWRTRVIFNTNLRTAYMAGIWKQVQATKKTRPYLIYMTVGDNRVRAQHANWHRLVLPVDDPWWDAHYPPNSIGCRCSVNTANDKQLERWGLSVGKAPPINLTRRINTRTGVDYGMVPEGIDPGWDYNVGKAWIGSDVAFGEKLMQLPTAIRREVLAGNRNHIAELGKSWKVWLKDRANDSAKGYAHTVGYLPSPVIDKLIERNIEPIGAAIIVFDRQTTHLLGTHKASHKRIPPDWLNNLPEELLDYQAILLHKDDLIFVLKETADGRNARAVIHVNFKKKGGAFNSVRSLGVSGLTAFRRADYELLEGKL